MDDRNGNARSKIAMLRGLRQVRQFGSERVSQEVIDDILEVARWTGSGMNKQPWEFVLIRNRETLQEIVQAENSGSYLAGADFAILVVMAGDNKEIESFDEARLTERMMLAGAAHGVGAGIWWFKDGGAAARRILGIPQERQVRTAVAFGYPSEGAASGRPKVADARKPLTQLVHEEKY
ncbi:MAG: nitroreductase family protein [Chloroflexia bacterium]